MDQLEMDYDHMEDDTLDSPRHVLRFETLLERYNYGVEPIDSWRSQDLASAFDCIATELIARGVEVPEAKEAEE